MLPPGSQRVPEAGSTSGRRDIGREGFYPFDLLAGAYVVEPHFFDCATAHAWVSRDARLRNWFYDPNALLVGFERATPADAVADGAVVYCPQVDPDLHGWLVARLTGSDPLAAGPSEKPAGGRPPADDAFDDSVPTHLAAGADLLRAAPAPIQLAAESG
jgi:hypothetical protein